MELLTICTIQNKFPKKSTLGLSSELLYWLQRETVIRCYSEAQDMGHHLIGSGMEMDETFQSLA